jgi:hypothetical protein
VRIVKIPEAHRLLPGSLYRPRMDLVYHIP